MSDIIPSSVNLANAREETPSEAPVLPPLVQVGVGLVKWVLVIMCIFLIVSLGVLLGMECLIGFEPTDAVDKMRGTFQEFWLKWVQLVLLNVMLPVLTALLGYVFGSSKKGD